MHLSISLLAAASCSRPLVHTDSIPVFYRIGWRSLTLGQSKQFALDEPLDRLPLELLGALPTHAPLASVCVLDEQRKACESGAVLAFGQGP